MYNGLELPNAANAVVAEVEAVDVDKEAARGKAPDGHGPSSFVHALLASSIG